MKVFDYEPSFGAATPSEAGEFGPYTSQIRDFLDRRIPNAILSEPAVEWWARQPTSYWRNWPAVRLQLWGDTYKAARRQAKTNDRTKAWRAAGQQARLSVSASGFLGTSERIRAIHICARDAARALTVVDLVDVAVLMESFHALEYGPNFLAVRDLLSRQIPLALGNRRSLDSWLRDNREEEDLAVFSRTVLNMVNYGAIAGTRPGSLHQAELARAAAMSKCLTMVPSDMAERDRNVLLLATMNYASATALRPLSDDSMLSMLDHPFIDLVRLAEGAN